MAAVLFRKSLVLCAIGALALSSSCRDAVAPSGIATVKGLKSDQGEADEGEGHDSQGKPTLSHACGNRFLVKNVSSDSLVVRWTVDHGSDSGSVWLPAKPSSGAYSERYFTTHGADTTRLFLKQRLVGKVANGGTVCPGSLTVLAGEGVVGLQSGTVPYANGATVIYNAQPAAGFTSVHVLLDGMDVSPSGTLTIAGARSLLAYAVLDSAALPVDPAFVQRFRGLLTSRHQVADYQSLIYASAALADQVGAARADSVLSASAEAAYHLPADVDALRRLDRALGGHAFSAESLPPARRGLKFGKGNTLPYGFPAPSTAPPGTAFTATSRMLATPKGIRNALGAIPLGFVMGGGGGGSGSGDGTPIAVVYVNGMSTNPQFFRQNLISRRRALRGTSGFPDSTLVTVTGVYQAGGGSSIRMLFRGLECMRTFFPALISRLPWWLRVQFIGACEVRTLQELAAGSAGGEAAEIMTQVAEIRTNTVPRTNSFAVDSLLKAERGADANRNHVIVVPHSQGNFFMIQSLQNLAGRGRAPTDSDAACLGMIPLASPTNVGYPASAFRLQPVQLLGDFINHSSLPQFPPVETALFDSLATPILGGLSIFDQLRMHDFVRSYLHPTGGLPLVQQGLRNIYRNCQRSISVDGQNVIGLTERPVLTATIRGADGAQITPNGAVRWEAADTTVLLVLSTGTGDLGNAVVMPRSPGSTRVSAWYAGRHGDKIVTVADTGNDPGLTIDVQVRTYDVPPFWIPAGSGERWRQRDISVRVTPTPGSSTVVQAVGFYAYDIYGTRFSFDEGPTVRDVYVSTQARFFDNPRDSRGKPVRWVSGPPKWMTQDHVFLSIHTVTDGVEKVRVQSVPLTP